MFTKESRYILLIILIFIAGCIETDIFLPALADMMAYFSVSEEAIQNLLTWNFIGICLAGPIYGPISDAIGRKKPLVVALGLFFLGSLMTLYAESFEWMLVGRLFQGLGCGGCFTLGSIVIFDFFQEKEAVLALNKINSIVPFIMALAPLIGGYLNTAYGFRSNFLAIAFCVLLSLFFCCFFLPETHPKEKRSPINLKVILANFKKVAQSIPFWQTTCIVSLLFSAYIAFLSGISVLFILELGVSKHALPYYQVAMLGSWVLASLTYKRSLQNWGDGQIKKIGTWLVAVGALCLAITALAAPQSPTLLTLGMVIYAFGANWTQGLYFPEAMSLFPENRGVAASLLTSARLLISAIVIGLTGFFYNSTIYPIAGVVVAILCVTLGIMLSYEQAKKVNTLTQV